MFYNNKFKNNFWQRILRSQLVIIIGIGFIVFFSTQINKQTAKRSKINSEIKNLQVEINRLEKKNSNIKNLISYFNSADFLESEARTKLGLKKDGEQVIVVDANPKAEFLPAKQSFNLLMVKSKSLTNMDKWFNYFFNNN